MKLRACLAPLALLAAGCSSVPTPLVPGHRGSVGGASFGVLTGADELPARGSGFRRFRPWSNHHFGTPALIRTIAAAAASVARSPDDPPLLVGDLSSLRGGPLSGHHSHRAGRDVDLLFYFTTPAGLPIEAPGFVKVEPDGLAFVEASDKKKKDEFVRFDLPRNWRLVRALLTSPHARAQWIFVSRPLKARLIEYALALGEPPALLWQAQNTLHQPGDSAPHDDHFHLRIACSDDETMSGCTTGDPYWPWWPAPPSLQPQAEDFSDLDPLSAG